MSGLQAGIAHTAVEVNLNIEVTANGELEILGEPLFSPQNVLVATEKVSAASLYAPSDSCALIEFWEDDEVDGIKAQLANTGSFGGYYKKAARRLAKDLQKVLCGVMEANATVVRPGTGANSGSVTFTTVPFNTYLTPTRTNQVHEHFGRVALATYAHYIMGHAQATAAITNDKAFMANMLSLGATDKLTAADSAADRYASYNAAANVAAGGETDPLANWIPSALAGSAADADLARRLVGALLNANRAEDGSLFVSSVDTDTGLNTAKRAADLVDQVIGQDASRARNEDNSKYGPESHGLLRFYPNDVIYAMITVIAPHAVTVGSGQQVGGPTLKAKYTAPISYMIRIVLE
jgi:hypothetical protein